MYRLFVLTPFIFSLLTACATTNGAGESSRTVLVDGQQVSVEVLADERFEEARTLRTAGDDDGAKTILESILVDFGDASRADDARVVLAQIHLDRDEPQAAQALLEDLLVNRPMSPAADQARYYLALSQLAQGDAASAAPVLKNIVDKMPNEVEKKGAAKGLAKELRAQGQSAEAVRYLNRALELTTDPKERFDLEEEMLALVDAEVSFTDVRRLAETEAKEGSFLDEAVSMKLARIHVHLRDPVAANQWVDRVLSRYPHGRFQADAESLKSELMARVVVDNRAIGVLLPLSGTYKAYGQRALTAMKLGLGISALATDYADDKTGEGTFTSVVDAKKNPGAKPVSIVVIDTKGDVSAATTGVKTLVEQHHVAIIVGDILLDTSMAVALKGEELGVPVLSLSRKDGLAELGPWTFRLSLTAAKQAKALAAFAMGSLGAKRFAILYPRHPYGIELMNGFWDEVEKREGEVTAIESYALDQTTFTDEAKSLVGRLNIEARWEWQHCAQKAREITDAYRRKKAYEGCRDEVTPMVDFDAILLPDDYRTVSYVVPALVAEDMLVSHNKYQISAFRKTAKSTRAKPIQLLGGNMWNDPELGKRLSTNVDGAVFVDGFNVNDETPVAQKFIKGFAAIHRSKPGLMEAQAHDAGLLLNALIDGRGGAAPTTRAEMRDVLSQAKDFPGVTGLIRFDENGDSVTPPQFFTFERGNIEVADPAALAAGAG